MIFKKLLTNKTQRKERKILIVFDDMIADKFNNKKFNQKVIDLFIRERKRNISAVLIT